MRHTWPLILILISTAHPMSAGTIRYEIEPGGQYTYLASPESSGVPGCDPSNFECSFGIDGSFNVMLDSDTRNATLLDVDLTLIGNDDVQQNAQSPLVTASGLADWLEERSFENLFVLGPFELFADQRHPNLLLTDFLNGNIELSGGFDGRLADGVGVHFELNAVSVPEPSTLALPVLGLVLFFFFPRVISNAFEFDYGRGGRAKTKSTFCKSSSWRMSCDR